MKLYKYNKTKYDEVVSSVLTVVVAIPFMTNFFGSVLNFVGMSTSYSTYAIYLFVVLYEYYQLLQVSYKKFVNSLLCQAAVTVVFLLNYCLVPASAVYFKTNLLELALLVIIYIPAGIYLLGVQSVHFFVDKMKILVYLTPFMGLASYLVFNIASMMNYMVFSTMILPGTLMCCHYMMNARGRMRAVYLLLFLADMYLLLSFGGRSPFLAVIVYIGLLYYRKTLSGSTAKKTMLFFCLVIGVIVLAVFGDLIIEMIVSLLEPYRDQSRIIDTIVNGEFFQSNEYGGRETIYGFAQKELSKMGLSVPGLFGDRLALSNHMATGGYKTNYVHNFYYEILLSFGWILGGIIITVVTLKTAKALLFRGQDAKFQLVAFFFCLEFIRLLVSGSFLVEGISVLFFCALFIREKKQNREEIYD